MGRYGETGRQTQRQLLFVILPLVRALAVPLLFSYLVFLWKASKFAASNIGDDALEHQGVDKVSVPEPTADYIHGPLAAGGIETLP